MDQTNDSNDSKDSKDKDENVKFNKIITDLTNDLLLTFPELGPQLETNTLSNTYSHCVEVFPKIFFEILYENDSLFEKECLLLPGIDFSKLMKEQISDKTKKTIWKYLQLILFCVLEDVNSKKSFGETSKIFEGVEEEELHKKIAETMDEMKGLFEDISGDAPTFDMDPDKMKSHLDELMNGKIGTLAKEIAEEAKSTIGDDKEFMQNVMKNPQKILSLVKNIGGKLEEKISSGQVKESELLEEATQIMDKIQDIPGLKEMMSKMGLNGKMDFKAMANKMQQHMKGSKTKERLQKKREQRQNERQGMAQNGMAQNGMAQNGMAQNGMAQNGMAQNGMAQAEAEITQKTQDTFVVKIGESPQKSNKKKHKKAKKDKNQAADLENSVHE